MLALMVSCAAQQNESEVARTMIRTLFLALFMMLASAAAIADTALHNVHGFTSSMDGIVEFTVLVFDEDGRVVATGDESLLERYPDTTRIDGGGRTVLPGLIDAHAHVYGYGALLPTRPINLTNGGSSGAAGTRCSGLSGSSRLPPR
jgi:hypothetical protein